MLVEITETTTLSAALWKASLTDTTILKDWRFQVESGGQRIPADLSKQIMDIPKIGAQHILHLIPIGDTT